MKIKIFRNIVKLSSLLILTFIMSFSFTACSKNKTDEGKSNIDMSTNNDMSSNHYMEFAITPGAAIEYSSNIKSDKKLVWACDNMLLDNVDKEVFNEFNRKLVEEYHCDFTVDFVGADCLDYESYQAHIRDRKKKGEQTDILYTGPGYESVPAVETYTQAIKDKLLIPWTDLLKNSEYGEKLYTAFDKNFWEGMKYKGTVYGFRPSAEASGGSYYMLANKEYYHEGAVRSSISFDNLDDILNQIADSNKAFSGNTVPVFINSDALCTFEGYLQVYNGYDGIYFKKVNNKWRFVNGTDEDRIKELWKKIRKYNSMLNYQGENAWTNTLAGDFCVALLFSNLPDYYKGKLILGENEYNVTELNSVGGYIIYPQNGITGIASWSEYPKEAMQLISLIETNADLSNLLKYGLEGKHYTLEKGKVHKLDNEGRLPTESSIANELITYPRGLEPMDKAEVYAKRNSRATLTPQVIYQLDFYSLSPQIMKIAKIYSAYSGLWNGEYEDVDQTVAKLQKELKDAGVDALIKKLNKLLPD